MTEQVAGEPAEANVLTDQDVPVLQPGVGEQLRAAREKAGMQLADVSQVLKLGVRQIEALENGDWDRLPGATFIRGFVRNYARLINIDPAPLMAQLDGQLEKQATVLSVPESSPTNIPYSSSGGRDDRKFVLIGLVAALLAALVYFLLPEDMAQWREDAQSVVDSLSRKDEPVAAPAAETAPANAPGSEPVFPPGTTPQQIMSPQSLLPAETPGATPLNPAEKPQAATSTAQLNFEIVRESWIEVRDRDEKVVFSQRLLAGSQKIVSGDGPLSLTIGYAPGVKLQWRGQPIDLEPHTRGDVARLVLE